MKEIKLISIQGKYAPYFHFRRPDDDEFRSIVDSETSGKALIISSAYRTDILYSSEVDLSDIIIKKWCEFMGYHYDTHVKSKFVRSNSQKETFELYYDTLLQLILHTNHFAMYKESFDLVKKHDSSHQLLLQLLQSRFKLSKSYAEACSVTYQDQYCELPTENVRDILNYKGFTSVALQALKDLHAN